MKFINNLKLKSKLFLIAAVPLMGLLFFSGLQISVNTTIYKEADTLTQLTQLIVQNVTLNHVAMEKLKCTKLNTIKSCIPTRGESGPKHGYLIYLCCSYAVFSILNLLCFYWE